MSEAGHKKRDEWITRIGLLGMAVFFGYSFIFVNLIYPNWIHFWLHRDAIQTTAIITGTHQHGVVDYSYQIGEKEFTGRSQRNWELEKYRNVGIGQTSIAFYSASHPWLSSLESPQFPRSGTIMLFVTIPIELLLIVTVINPRSSWAMNVFQDKDSRTKS
jgi:hypothetical protein